MLKPEKYMVSPLQKTASHILQRKGMKTQEAQVKTEKGRWIPQMKSSKTKKRLKLLGQKDTIPEL